MRGRAGAARSPAGRPRRNPTSGAGCRRRCAAALPPSMVERLATVGPDSTAVSVSGRCMWMRSGVDPQLFGRDQREDGARAGAVVGQAGGQVHGVVLLDADGAGGVIRALGAQRRAVVERGHADAATDVRRCVDACMSLVLGSFAIPIAETTDGLQAIGQPHRLGQDLAVRRSRRRGAGSSSGGSPADPCPPPRPPHQWPARWPSRPRCCRSRGTRRSSRCWCRRTGCPRRRRRTCTRPSRGCWRARR